MVRLPQMSRQTAPRFGRATILVNPVAHRIHRFDGEGAVRYLARRGTEARLVVPASAAEASRAAEAAAARGDDALFVVGGDGSLRDAVRGMAGSETVLAPIPAGTANVLAREIGLPRGLRAAFDAHLGGQAVRMDTGRCNGDPFLMMAGFGWDADVVEHVHYGLKRRTGQLAYVVSTMRRFVRLRTVDARWSSGLAHWQGRLALMVVGNTRLYGGLLRVTAEARANDGELDFVALCPRRPLQGTRLALRLLVQKADRDVAALSGRVPELEFETPGVPYHLDGDFAGHTPARLAVDRLAVRLSVPAGPIAPAFAPGE